MEHIILVAAIIIFAYMALFYIIALLLKNNSVVDIGWGLGFITLISILHIFFPVLYIRKILITFLIVLWGFRLAAFVFARNIGKTEDSNYARFCEKWGKRFFLFLFFKVFILYGLIMLIMAYPIILVFNSDPSVLTIYDIIGVMLFIFGFLFESISDYQLAKFKSKPENNGKLMINGLWKYSRHPNYFGEVVLWWGLFFIALSSNYGWTGIISPLLITIILTCIYGIPSLEKKFKGREDWEAYKAKTPKFFPSFMNRT